jgi:hypothetical protein
MGEVGICIGVMEVVVGVVFVVALVGKTEFEGLRGSIIPKKTPIKFNETKLICCVEGCVITHIVFICFMPNHLPTPITSIILKQ